MCEPMTMAAAGLALGATTSAVGYVGSMQQANAQAAYQDALVQQRNQQMRENERQAMESYNAQLHQITRQQQQLNDQASGDLTAAGVAAARARSTARTTSGEAGVAGLSVDTLLMDFDRQEASYRDSVLHNREWQLEQGEYNKTALGHQAAGRIASMQPIVPQPVQMPSFLASALQIGGHGLDAVSGYQSATRSNEFYKQVMG
jgi:multidrug efflux pump subunit AcrA (membrane-fusion protein)